MKKLNNTGFTIIELLIASMIFTSVLLLCVEGITRIAKVYVKNTSVSRANDFAKTLIEEVSGQIKFGVDPPSYSINIPEIKLCSAGKAYKITLNQQSNSSVLRKSDPTCSGYILDDFFNTQAESLTPNSTRVLDFNITENVSTASWYISMRVAIGDSDLLIAGNGAEISTASAYNDFKDARCVGGISGSEFCAVVALSTIVTRRMD